ncbi:hypothetical protein K523DRAFT_109432 [Schizophyllum commune Tattone D]|nr:hypothetical protein K523DRAFT_109432 [Schizophyllum commune Tattone D]
MKSTSKASPRELGGNGTDMERHWASSYCRAVTPRRELQPWKHPSASRRRFQAVQRLASALCQPRARSLCRQSIRRRGRQERAPAAAGAQLTRYALDL